eukprot:CAMPEP_0175134630 /NCGR_PEP_ID=MMETSP0087-20121206/8282_1 /TAXON_ID=136419 /ORGANISM="Unknown Unknown, Strain D1" /LENGTH=233 /DNA_ID=CAMNT_0016417207 /DNA_START=76 /DNA_END=776 /DNA_ORIENTATION=+
MRLEDEPTYDADPEDPRSSAAVKIPSAQSQSYADHMETQLERAHTRKGRKAVKKEKREAAGVVQVFLGGACNPTIWRKRNAIPLLKKHGITFFNPQRSGLTRAMLQQEAKAKQSALVLLFVIPQNTRSILAMIEVAEYLCVSKRRNVVVVIEPIQEQTVIAHQVIKGRELEELNKGRFYLEHLVKRHPDTHIVMDNVHEAVMHIIGKIKNGEYRPPRDGNGCCSATGVSCCLM